MARTRVLRVIARMNVGGPALQVTTLTRGLPADRFETRLLVGDVGAGEADWTSLRADGGAAGAGGTGDNGDHQGLDVVRIPGLGRDPDPLGDVRALAAVVREIRAFRPDIVHTHTAKAGALGRVAAFACRMPATVHTFHGHLLSGYFSPRVTGAIVLTERVLALRTTRLVAVGTRVRDELLAAGVGRPAQYAVVAPGLALPPAPMPPEARATLGLPPDRPVVAFVARLTAVKRPDRFVDVATQLAARHPDTLFVVAGEGPLAYTMRASAECLGDAVRFLGWRGDVETVYAAADVVVLTSDNEGMPVSLIEAAHAGRPAVTTAVGSAAEVVVDGETGFVTGPSPESLADAVSRLLDDPALRSTMGKTAAERAARLFTPSRLIADTVRLYDEIRSRSKS
ncbi:MAG: glycosyltransferase [Acidimicrobiales bacterium]